MTEDSEKPVHTREAGEEPAEARHASEGSAAAQANEGDEPSVAADEVEEPSRASLASAELAHVRRPVEMYLGTLFLTLAALPLILVGAALALQIGAIGENLRQRITATGTGLDVGSLILLFRMAGGLLLVIGLLFAVFAWTALKPKRWARTAATVLAVVEIVLLVVAMVVTAVDPVSLGIVLLAGAGVALLYLPRSEEYLLTSR